ncbi:MAG: AAA family ATPase [Polyangiales bacterium]
MRLVRYAVRGFKNLTGMVELDELGPINILHGENNVGKSNVLQSIGWLFTLLSEKHAPAHPNDSEHQFGYAIQKGSPFQKRFVEEGVFNLRSPGPIEWKADLFIDPADFERAGIAPTAPATVKIAASLVDQPAGAQFTCGFSTPRAAFQGPKADALRELIVRGFAPSTRAASAPFALVDTQRRLWGQGAQEPAATQAIIPDSLVLALYDARESFEQPERARWEAFQRAMDRLAATLGGGKILVSFQRSPGKGVLFYERDDLRVPAHLLGTGVQQVISLAARVVTSSAAVVAIEEPELNLRYSLQLTLREMLDALVGAPSGVQQLFLTSHSPAFEHGKHFYWMRHLPDGPRVERRPIREAAAVTAMDTMITVPEGSAVPSYVTSEGLTRLPGGVVENLRLEHGGHVYFHRPAPDGPYQFLTEEQFFALWPQGSYPGSSS